jgi:hypothetical protein
MSSSDDGKNDAGAAPLPLRALLRGMWEPAAQPSAGLALGGTAPHKPPCSCKEVSQRVPWLKARRLTVRRWKTVRAYGILSALPLAPYQRPTPILPQHPLRAGNSRGGRGGLPAAPTSFTGSFNCTNKS